MNLSRLLSTLALLSSYICGTIVEGGTKYKILVHTNLGRSHVKPLFEVCKVLRKNGHEVKYAAIDENSKYALEFGFDFISLGKGYGGDEKKTGVGLTQFLIKKKKLDMLPLMGKVFSKRMAIIYDETFQSFYEAVQQYQPDFIMCDFFATACRDVAEKFEIPFLIGFQTVDAFNVVPSTTNTNSARYMPVTTKDLTFLERFDAKIYQPLRAMYYYSSMVGAMNAVRKKYDVPASDMPMGRFDNVYGISSTFIGFEPANAIPPNIQMIGPILSDDHALLPDSLKNFLNNNDRVLYIAFGSSLPLQDFDIDNLLPAALQAIENNVIDAIVWGLGKTLPSNFPKTITLFNETIEVENLIEGEHEKIRILKWAPQIAILKHPNCKIFISHGGLESSFEAITSATPLIVIPVFADQPRNARKLEDMGIGKHLDRIDTNPTETYEAIKYIVQDPDNTIKPNLEKFKLISLQNSKRKFRVARDIEHLISLAKVCRKSQPFKYGEISCELKHLIPVYTHMSFIKANNLDLYLAALCFLTVVTLGIGYGVYLAASKTLGYWFNRSTNETKKSQ